MKKTVTLLALLFISFSASAQVIFSEDFDGITGPTAGGAGTYVFPSGWFLRNVDNRTPSGSVAYVNEAWERREDFSFNVADSCAFSTSWYSPAGASDDWMWTPLIGPLSANTNLNWNAVTYDASYPDGYEVRIMTAASGPPTGGTGVLGNQLTNSTQVFSVGAENTTWTAHSVSLAAYAGQSVYIGFRNNSNDKFLLLIDDIVVVNTVNVDAQMVRADTTTEYTLIPQSETAPLDFNGTIRNNGVAALSNVSAHVDVWQGATNVYSANSAAVASLAPSATTNFVIPSYTPTAIGNYTVKIYAQQTSGVDQIPANDTAVYQYFVVTDSTYGRDDGTVTGALGIGAGNGGYLGQGFYLPNQDTLTSISMFFTRGYTGRRYAAVVWNTDATFTPTTILTGTDTLLYPDDSARFYTTQIHGDALVLPAGHYAVTAIEFDSTIQVGLTMNVFTPGSTWVNWPTNPFGTWAHNEAFGAGFARSYVIRPNFGNVCADNMVAAAVTSGVTCLTCTDGSAAVTSSSGTNGAVTYAWSPSGGNAATATGLATGSYTVTMTDAFGCVSMATVTVPYDTCTNFSVNMTSTQASCATCADGSAMANIVSSNGPVTYSWSNSATTQAITNVLPGTYYVTLADSIGCMHTDSVVVPYDLCSNYAATTSATQASCATCADGGASIAVSNSNGPVTYLWSNSATTLSISNVLSGWYTVTVTDTLNCSHIDSVFVPYDICTNYSATISSTLANCATCPDGTATVNVTSSNGPVTYLWNNGGTTASITGLLTGTYTVTITDSAGCVHVETILVDFAFSVKNLENVGSAAAYPNPTSGDFTLLLNFTSVTNATIEVNNMLGQVVIAKQIEDVKSVNIPLSLTEFGRGLYMVKITTSEGVLNLQVDVQ